MQQQERSPEQKSAKFHDSKPETQLIGADLNLLKRPITAVTTDLMTSSNQAVYSVTVDFPRTAVCIGSVGAGVPT